jgi:hypothetical protein
MMCQGNVQSENENECEFVSVECENIDCRSLRLWRMDVLRKYRDSLCSMFYAPYSNKTTKN